MAQGSRTRLIIVINTMQIVSYVHPTRTYLPCTGVGRHINNLLLGLHARDDCNLQLLFSAQWLEANGKLNPRSPLSTLPFTTFPTAENSTERSWKLWGRPRMDRYLPGDTDWLYAPMETYLPVSKCPVAITLHDIQAFEPDLPWSGGWQHRWFAYKWGRWVRTALTECRVVFTVSEFSKQRMVDLLGADPNKIVVIGNGIDPAFFELAQIAPETIDRPIASPYTIVIGGLRQKKGADYVLAVARALERRRSELQIVVAGESEHDYLTAAAEYANITLLGMVADRDLPFLVKSASSLLFLSPYEGFGIPPLEAMAAGVPVVVSDRASLPEIVGDAGIILDPTLPEPIADVLIDLDQMPQLRSDYIQRGSHHVSRYTWSSCLEKAIAAFHTFA